MKIISDSALQSRMSEYFHELENTGEELLVTHEGQTVMKIISYQREVAADSESSAEDQGKVR